MTDMLSSMANIRLEYLRWLPEEVVDGKIVVGPNCRYPAQGHMDMGIVVGCRAPDANTEPVLERQIHYFVNGASGIQHVGQRDIAWIRVSNAAAEKGFNLEHFGKILHARFHEDFGAIVDKVQVTIYTDPSPRRVAGNPPMTSATSAGG
jgi:acetyl-CoA synthase